jgi:hypothetical protein
VLLTVVVLVALGIGTFEMYGHYAARAPTSGQKDAAEAAAKPSNLDTKAATRSEDEPAEPKPEAAGDSAAEQRVSARDVPAAADAEGSSAMDSSSPPPAVLPEAAPQESPPPRAVPRRSAPAAARQRPVAPAAPRPKLPAQRDRDYGI